MLGGSDCDPRHFILKRVSPLPLISNIVLEINNGVDLKSIGSFLSLLHTFVTKDNYGDQSADQGLGLRG